MDTLEIPNHKLVVRGQYVNVGEHHLSYIDASPIPIQFVRRLSRDTSHIDISALAHDVLDTLSEDQSYTIPFYYLNTDEIITLYASHGEWRLAANRVFVQRSMVTWNVLEAMVEVMGVIPPSHQH